MFRRFKTVLVAAMIAAMFCQSVSAETRILLISNGRYFLIDFANSTPTIDEIVTVINAGGPTTPPPTASTRDKVTALTKATNDPLIAQGIAQGAYATVRERLNADALTWEQSMSILKAATDLAISQSSNKTAWDDWRTGIGAIIDDMQRAGELGTKAQQVGFLSDVETGMKNAFPNSAIDLEKLLTLIRAIIDLITNLIGQQKAEAGEVSSVPLVPQELVAVVSNGYNLRY